MTTGPAREPLTPVSARRDGLGWRVVLVGGPPSAPRPHQLMCTAIRVMHARDFHKTLDVAIMLLR